MHREDNFFVILITMQSTATMFSAPASLNEGWQICWQLPPDLLSCHWVWIMAKGQSWTAFPPPLKLAWKVFSLLGALILTWCYWQGACQFRDVWELLGITLLDCLSAWVWLGLHRLTVPFRFPSPKFLIDQLRMMMMMMQIILVHLYCFTNVLPFGCTSVRTFLLSIGCLSFSATSMRRLSCLGLLIYCRFHLVQNVANHRKSTWAGNHQIALTSAFADVEAQLT